MNKKEEIRAKVSNKNWYRKQQGERIGLELSPTAKTPNPKPTARFPLPWSVVIPPSNLCEKILWLDTK
jgi:hypothetical protein